MTRQQALTAATIVVAGSTGDSLGAERLSDVFGLACEYARGEHDGSAMDDMATWAHPLGWGRINMGDTSLAADGLCLAARASRTPEEHATVLSIAGQIVRGHPAEIVLNGVGHALAALPDLAAAPARVRRRVVHLPLGVLALCRRPPLGAGLCTCRHTRGHRPARN
jgi:hypothetical protein